VTSFSEYRTFCKIVELNSVTEAANALHKSPSAVSKQLSKLESSLSVQLFDRSTKTITITALGEKFYHQCKAILQSVNDAEQALKDDTTAASGKLVLSFPEVLLRTPLIKLITEFSGLYRDIHFELRVSNTLDNIIEEGIDFAFRIGKIENSRLIANTLFPAHLVCVASPEYLNEFTTPTSFSDVIDQHKMLLPTYVNIREKINQLLNHTEAISLQDAHLMNSETAIFDAVMQGMGVAALLDISIQPQIDSGELIHLFPELTFPRQDVCMLYHNRDYMPKKMRLFKEYIKQEYLL
jgi:DNA-binding transcriptional LysR family regulator